MIKKGIILFALFLLALGSISCFEPSPPKAKYKDYEISRVTLQGFEIDFYFDVDNPNPVPIDISGYSYQVYINNREFLSENRAGFRLPSSGKETITIPVYVRYDRLFGTAISIVERIAKGENTIDYRIEGSLRAGVAGISVKTPLKASGKIPIPKDINL